MSAQNQQSISATINLVTMQATLTIDLPTLASIITAQRGNDGARAAHPISAAPLLNEGEHYAGIVFGKDGAASHHVILLPGEAADVNWSAAGKWAASVGGELPTRCEQSLLFTNLKERFQSSWYWSSEQHATISGYAWSQDFGNGYQLNYRKDLEFAARAVRRLAI